jgi:hypothetical protein
MIKRFLFINPLKDFTAETRRTLINKINIFCHSTYSSLRPLRLCGGLLNFCILALLIGSTSFYGCIYTLSGSSLPPGIKTVEVPLFANQSLEPNVADEITRQISNEIVTGNLLKMVQQNGNAVINGTVTSYTNEPYTFGASATRRVDVQQYVVRITADIDFLDVKKNESIYKGQVTGEGIYDLSKQTEQDGKQAAIKELVQRVMSNSVQGW